MTIYHVTIHGVATVAVETIVEIEAGNPSEAKFNAMSKVLANPAAFEWTMEEGDKIVAHDYNLEVYEVHTDDGKEAKVEPS